MGTNYYTTKGTHIGKKSAAGLYCWDCKTTLCKDGHEGIHKTVSEERWFKICPQCGAKPRKETLKNSAAGRELGFNKNEYKEKTGVASCSSFNWAILPVSITRLKKIKDEYGQVFTLSEFMDILKECPIYYYNNIGKDFS